MPLKKYKSYNITADQKTLDEFDNYCSENGLKKSFVLGTLIKEYMESV